MARNRALIRACAAVLVAGAVSFAGLTWLGGDHAIVRDEGPQAPTTAGESTRPEPIAHTPIPEPRASAPALLPAPSKVLSVAESRGNLVERIEGSITDIHERRETPHPPADGGDPKSSVEAAMKRALCYEVVEVQLKDLKQQAEAAETTAKLDELNAMCDRLLAHLKDYP